MSRRFCNIHGYYYGPFCLHCFRQANANEDYQRSVLNDKKEEDRRRKLKNERIEEEERNNSIVEVNKSVRWEVFCPRCERAVCSHFHPANCPNCSKSFAVWTIKRGSGKEEWRGLCSAGCSPEREFGDSIPCPECLCMIRTTFYRWYEKRGCLAGCGFVFLVSLCAFVSWFTLVSLVMFLSAIANNGNSEPSVLEIISILSFPVFVVVFWRLLSSNRRKSADGNMVPRGFNPPAHWNSIRRQPPALPE